MSRGGKPPEAELGAAVTAYLRDQRWTVYQEVALDGGIADVVATQGQLLAIVELKNAFSLDVIAQARRWLTSAHWTWIAVPRAKDGGRPSEGRRLGHRLCDDLGVGVFEVSQIGPMDRRALASSEEDRQFCSFDAETFHANRVRAVAAPRLQRRALATAVRAVLRPGHQTYAAAGERHGRHWSPFQQTCAEVRIYLKTHGGEAELATVVREIRHHYHGDPSARSHLARWAEEGAIPGISVDRSGRRVVVRLASPQE